MVCGDGGGDVEKNGWIHVAKRRRPPWVRSSPLTGLRVVKTGRGGGLMGRVWVWTGFGAGPGLGIGLGLIFDWAGPLGRPSPVYYYFFFLFLYF